MILVAFVPKAGVDLCEELSAQSVKTKLVRHGVIVWLPGRVEQSYFVMGPGLYGEFQIPEAVPANSVLRLQEVEKGGARLWSSSGRVVASLSGGRLKPYRIFRYPKPNGVHACFSARDGICVIEFDDPGSGYINVYIQEFRIEVIGERTVEVRGICLHAGHHDFFGHYATTEMFHRYEAAVEAAAVKARCHGCTHIHYGVV